MLDVHMGMYASVLLKESYSKVSKLICSNIFKQYCNYLGCDYNNENLLNIYISQVWIPNLSLMSSSSVSEILCGITMQCISYTIYHYVKVQSEPKP